MERKERAPDADDALHAAVTKGEVRALKAALLAGARLESRRGGQARTALLAAVALRELAVVKVLVAAGAKLGAKDERGEDSVFLAAARGDVKLLDLLHRAGAKLRARTSSGQTPLHIAVLSGHLPLVRRLLALGAAKDLRLLDEALVCAVNRERPEIARLLLKAGARVDVEDEGTGLTPLEAAAYRGSLRTAKVLLEAGGAQDLDAALREAAAEGDARMARLLLAAGANPLHRSAKGNTALALARKRRHLAVVALLSKPRS